MVSTPIDLEYHCLVERVTTHPSDFQPIFDGDIAKLCPTLSGRDIYYIVNGEIVVL